MRLLVQSRWGVRAVSAAALIGAFAFVPGLARAAITTNPANRPVLLSQPIEDLHYDYAKRCLSHPQPGTLALQSWLEDNWRGVSWGIMRCEKLSPHNYSLHSEGRAIDWHLDAGVPAEYHAAMRLIDMLLATDEDGNEAALARRMGVQGLIFNCRQWFGYGDRLSPLLLLLQAGRQAAQAPRPHPGAPQPHPHRAQLGRRSEAHQLLAQPPGAL